MEKVFDLLHFGQIDNEGQIDMHMVLLIFL
jgi:hypothetical protein